jgi:hypothetical protein
LLDQLIIGDKASYDDFGASVAYRTIEQPKKKEIKETIPFSNVTYDFSAINGEVYWNERKLEYVFEMTASTPQELEEMKIAFASWIMNIQDEKIFDPFIADYHFEGTYSEMSFEDEDCMEKTTATVAFMAYPYKIANVEKTVITEIPYSDSMQRNVEIVNNSSHRLMPTVVVEGNVSIKVGNTTADVGSGTFVDDALILPVGETKWTITNKGTVSAKVTISFFEEVF